MTKEEKPIKFRHELKHFINMSDYLAIRQRLRVVAKTDANAKDGGYRVRSLYFETPEDKALKEKLDGINNREKFRIRYYNDDASFIKLEKKTKINGVGSKLSAPVSREECKGLIESDINWMADSKYPLVLELYAKMKYQRLSPKTIVDYYREPFAYEPGNVRVTLDSQIRTGINSKDFFNKECPTIQANGGNTIILEVKYDEFLPTIIKDVVQTKNRKSTAFSKYAASRIFG